MGVEMTDVGSLIVLALGVARLTILITRDSILDPVREMIFLWSPPENDESKGWRYQNAQRSQGGGWHWRSVEVRQPGVIGEVISCPDCTGMWVALVVLGAHVVAPAATLVVCTLLTLALAASWIARKGGYS